MALVNIGTVQFAPRLGEPTFNRRKLAELIRRAPPADLLVLPELCISGYHFESWQQAWALSERMHPRTETVRMLQTLSTERNVTLVAGVNERDPDTDEKHGRIYNSAVVVTPSADQKGLQGVYRKVHLFNTEKQFFTAGDEFRLFDLPLREGGTARLGVLICFDWSFPEAWRVLQLMGADIVAHPSNLVIPGKCQQAVPALAMLHRMAIATANRWGNERGLRFTGESLIAGPDGSVLDRSGPDGDRVGTALLDLHEIRDKQITERNHAFTDRRPDLYGAITKIEDE